MLRFIPLIVWIPIGVLVTGFFKGAVDESDDIVEGEVYLMTILFWPLIIAIMLGFWLYNRAFRWGQKVAGHEHPR